MKVWGDIVVVGAILVVVIWMALAFMGWYFGW